jgi:hypothetical protein
MGTREKGGAKQFGLSAEPFLASKFSPSIVAAVTINGTYEFNETFLLYNFGGSSFNGHLSEGLWPRPKA